MILWKTESLSNLVDDGKKNPVAGSQSTEATVTKAFCPCYSNIILIIASTGIVFALFFFIIFFRYSYASNKGLNSEQDGPLVIIFFLSSFSETLPHLFPSLSLSYSVVVTSPQWRSWQLPSLETHSGWTGEPPTCWWPTSPPPRRSDSPQSLLSPGGHKEEKTSWVSSRCKPLSSWKPARVRTSHPRD